jgi:hypothetical protein
VQEGADSHDQVNNLPLLNQTMDDWLDDSLLEINARRFLQSGSAEKSGIASGPFIAIPAPVSNETPGAGR